MNGAVETTHSRRDAQKKADQAANETADAGQIEPSADDLIRKMIVAEKREINRAALPELEPVHQPDAPQPDPRDGFVKHPRKKFGLMKAFSSKRTTQPLEVAANPPPGPTPKHVAAIIASVRDYRPTLKHTVYAAIAAVFLASPWTIPIILFVTFWVVLIAYLTLGPDRVAELVVVGWQALHKRRPALAEVIRQRAEMTALRIDGFLDRMPEKWRDGIQIPDFSTNKGAADDRPDPFERLTKEAPQS